MTRITKLALLTMTVCVTAASGGCIATNSGVASGTSEGCEAITGDKIDDGLDVDATVRVFMQASVDFRGIGRTTKVAVKTACVNIAKDLGVADSWTALGDTDDSISNKSATGACDVATARIRAIMEAPGSATASFAIVSSPGACRIDFAAQAACDAKCKAEAVCDSGKVETRCTPGSLACVCDEKCKATSYCEGTVELEASCGGSCEATCTGHCAGTCTTKEGKKSNNDPSCHGKCSTTCTGTCSGRCKVEVEAGISCGTKVRCKGECTSTYTDPVCETQITPPVCKVDASCEDSCTASVTAHAVCDPPHVEIYADASVSADVSKLIATLDANLPPLVAVAEQQGKLALDAGTKLVSTGQTLVGSVTKLTAKSVVCTAAAAKASVEAAASLSISVKASADLTAVCRTHAS